MTYDKFYFVSVDAREIHVIVTGLSAYATGREVSDAVSARFQVDCRVIREKPMEPMTVMFKIPTVTGHDMERLVAVYTDLCDLLEKFDTAERDLPKLPLC